MINDNESDLVCKTSQSGSRSSENKTDSEDTIQKQCALKFVIKELYVSVKKTNFDLRYIAIYNILSPYLYVVFVVLEYSKAVKGT
jgi:hypothetical protein